MCRRVLDRYLEEQGFAEKETGAIGEIVYKRSDVFLEIGYEPETCPNYSPTVVLGIGDCKYDQVIDASLFSWMRRIDSSFS